MKYTKTEIKKFAEEVCPNCNKCNLKTEVHLAGCPRIFYWKLGYKNGVPKQLNEY